MTRSADKAVSWDERFESAEGADLYISLHANRYAEHIEGIFFPMYSNQNPYVDDSKYVAESFHNRIKVIDSNACLGSFTSGKSNRDEYGLVASVDMPALILNIDLEKWETSGLEPDTLAEILSTAISQSFVY